MYGVSNYKDYYVCDEYHVELCLVGNLFLYETKTVGNFCHR